MQFVAVSPVYCRARFLSVALTVTRQVAAVLCDPSHHSSDALFTDLFPSEGHYDTSGK